MLSEIYYTLLPWYVNPIVGTQQAITDYDSTPDEVLNDDYYTYSQFLLLLPTIAVVMKPKKAWVVYIGATEQVFSTHLDGHPEPHFFFHVLQCVIVMVSRRIFFL